MSLPPRAAFVLIALGLLAGSAHAGFRTSAWSFDTRTVPERQAELELWITQLVSGPDGATGTTAVLLAPVIGITDQLELAIPLTAEYARATDATQLTSWGIDARYRILPARPGQRFSPLIRAGARRLVAKDDAFRLSADLVLGIDPMPRLHIVLNAGVSTITKPKTIVAEYSAGIFYAVADDIRLGVDAFGTQELSAPGPTDGWFAAGPGVSLSHGRFWVAASVPFGITSKAPDAMPRLIWALAF